VTKEFTTATISFNPMIRPGMIVNIDGTLVRVTKMDSGTTMTVRNLSRWERAWLWVSGRARWLWRLGTHRIPRLLWDNRKTIWKYIAITIIMLIGSSPFIVGFLVWLGIIPTKVIP